MKSIVLAAAVALPVLLTGCAAYVGDTGPGYPGYYDGGYYAGGPAVDVGFYSYDRGSYHHNYHHYDNGGGFNHSAVASRGSSHVGGATHVASAGRVGGGHSGGASHSAASVSASHSGGGFHR